MQRGHHLLRRLLLLRRTLSRRSNTSNSSTSNPSPNRRHSMRQVHVPQGNSRCRTSRQPLPSQPTQQEVCRRIRNKLNSYSISSSSPFDPLDPQEKHQSPLPPRLPRIRHTATLIHRRLPHRASNRRRRPEEVQS